MYGTDWSFKMVTNAPKSWTKCQTIFYHLFPRGSLIATMMTCSLTMIYNQIQNGVMIGLCPQPYLKLGF